MKTEILQAIPSAIERAVHTLIAGKPVALPTETVYGLAANALDPLACARIFEAKARPLSDPLIVHLPSIDWLARIAVPSELAQRLAEKFWPGPLTMVLPRCQIVPDIVTAGEETVAVRMSAHPVFRAVAEAAATPLAAPSANRFGRISPTRVEHVLAELGSRIDLILDGGPCAYGIESTIVMIANNGIEILRHGPFTSDDLANFAPLLTTSRTVFATPGSFKSHYAPMTPLDLVSDLSSNTYKNTGLLAWRPVQNEFGFVAVETLSASGNLREVAANLYAGMRKLDALGLDRILALSLPEIGLGAAIMERLRKASHRV